MLVTLSKGVVINQNIEILLKSQNNEKTKTFEQKFKGKGHTSAQKYAYAFDTPNLTTEVIFAFRLLKFSWQFIEGLRILIV